MDMLVADQTREDQTREDQQWAFGSLLSAHRSDNDLTLESVVEASGVTVGHLLALEIGLHDLSGAQLSRVIDCYRISSEADLRRLVVVVDLNHGTVSINKSRRRCIHQPADRVLVRYLQLLYSDQGLSVGDSVSLKQVDLSVLRGSLALRRDDVRSKVDKLTDGSGTAIRRARTRPLLMALAGLTVTAGVVVIGPNVMGSGSVSANQAPAVALVTAPADVIVPSVATASAVPSGSATEFNGPQLERAALASVQITPDTNVVNFQANLLEFDSDIAGPIISDAMAEMAAVAKPSTPSSYRRTESVLVPPTTDGGLGTALIIEP